jgi:GntR family transcriptional repressor for pyruvate dehydrogenase complex
MAKVPVDAKPGGERLYLQVAAQLADDITSGQHQLGSRLPAERELATLLSVSRATVREAIIALETRGLVEVRMGSGVYVTDIPTASRMPIPMNIDPFELSEARLLFEGEIAAQAATQITEDQLSRLEAILHEMDAANKGGHGELADRRFHQAIADATRNGAMAALIDALWTIRLSSPKCVQLFERSRRRGTKPVIAEHRAILNALRAHDPAAARLAMRAHLQRVLDYLLDATERDALSEARAKITAQRRRFAPAFRSARSS